MNFEKFVSRNQVKNHGYKYLWGNVFYHLKENALRMVPFLKAQCFGIGSHSPFSGFGEQAFLQSSDAPIHNTSFLVIK